MKNFVKNNEVINNVFVKDIKKTFSNLKYLVIRKMKFNLILLKNLLLKILTITLIQKLPKF